MSDSKKSWDTPVVFLSEAEQSAACQDMYGNSNRLSEDQIGKACGAAIERKESSMYADGWRYRGGRNTKIR